MRFLGRFYGFRMLKMIWVDLPVALFFFGGLLCTVQHQCTAEKLSFEQSRFRILSRIPIELKVRTTLIDSTLDIRSKIFLKACSF